MKYYSLEELSKNPSVNDGLPMELFETVRTQCIELILASVEKLSLPVLVAAKAGELFQRFCQHRSLLRNDRLIVATACVFTASKVQQVDGKHKNIKDVIYACFDAHYGYENNPVRLGSKHQETLNDIRSLTVRVEQVLLFDILGFDFESEVPYGHMVSLLHKAGFGKLADQHHRAIQHLCWCLVNDSIQTNLCLRYTGDEIARGVVLAASKLARFELPSNVVFVTGNANRLASVIPEIERDILDLYE